MRILPIGITVFLFNFPAGLFVYWITSNLVTLVQNYVIYNHGPGKKKPEDEAKKASAQAISRNGKGEESDQKSPEDAVARAAKTAKRKRRKKKK